MSRHSIKENYSTTLESPLEIILNNEILTIMPPIRQKIKHDGQKDVIDLPVFSCNNSYKKDITAPNYNKYEYKEKIIKYKEHLNINGFKEFLKSTEYFEVNQDELPKFSQYLDLVIDNEEMIVDLTFTHEQVNSDLSIIPYEKSFLRKIDNNLSPFYNETTPSIISYNTNWIIDCPQPRLYDSKVNDSYLRCEYYPNLNIIVHVIINPDENKMIPAIVITDYYNTPIEVHFYHQKQYMPSAIIKELKPNLLKEDFRAVDYFEKRDIELLNMLRI